MKHALFAALRGAGMGMALNSVICLASSYWLKLGYYAPCFVALMEPCGGELNGALVQNGVFAVAGAFASLISLAFARRNRRLNQASVVPFRRPRRVIVR